MGVGPRAGPSPFSRLKLGVAAEPSGSAERTMRKTVSVGAMLAVAVFSVCLASFAQSGGEAAYKAKCQSCHGAAGVPSPAMAKAMQVKPVTDPAVKSKSEAQMVELTKNGVGKMPAYKGKLSDAEIKAAVAYFRSFAK
jgi:mono/diheme cytochrome c family protein